MTAVDCGSTTEADAAAYEQAHHGEEYDPTDAGYEPEWPGYAQSRAYLAETARQVQASNDLARELSAKWKDKR